MPVTYASLTARDRDWGLDDFVAEVNRLLPEVVPADAAARGKLEITPRLVRHYTTEGVLPKPLKEGVEARYDGDHLVRALALRRLLAEGYPSTLAGRFLERHDRERLARFLLGELRPDLDLAPGGPAVVEAPLGPGEAALERLAAMRARAGLPPLRQVGAAAERSSAAAPSMRAPRRSPAAPLAADSSVGDDTDRDQEPNLHERAGAPAASPPPPADRGVTWTRYPLLDGIELHVRDDFVDPTTPASWNALRDALLARLEAIALERTLRRR
ncbi:MAG: MerR family transcriptional regulator [Trueperaceae bacterium]|nr:MerR family transcriptional regulator [Trueperaceae bacterium]